MRTPEQQRQFESFVAYAERPYHVYRVTENSLTLNGGGYFYGCDECVPDAETSAEAERIATLCGMRITGAYGTWQGYSEYTPDPGDLSVFEWEEAE